MKSRSFQLDLLVSLAAVQLCVFDARCYLQFHDLDRYKLDTLAVNKGVLNN
ncbi:hypothetical protein AAFX24_16560 [Vibrio mediterranei]